MTLGTEIEGKFLVKHDGWKAQVRESQLLRQFYLARNERISLRVRLIDADEAVVTLKSAARGRVRAEYEYAIPLADAEEMMALREGNVVEKRRHHVLHGGKIFEVDVFEGVLSGLVTAEIELSDANEAFERPDWLGEEVTDDPAYSNQSLALNGLPKGG